MSLRERLHGLGTRSTVPAPVHPTRSAQRERPPLDNVFGGAVLETSHGPCYVVERSFGLDHRHGPVCLGEALTLSRSAWGLLCRDSDMEGLDLHRAIFMDTETTGLAGGTGTHAFLVGVGMFDSQGFTVRQFFLRDYDEERAMLAAVHDLLSAGDAYVTFNGKMFDLPLLATRYVTSRLRLPLPEHRHLDLLHPARRLWKDRLTDCRLATLDAAILGLSRQDDLPGWQVPALYVDYLRGGRAEPLRAVLAHNLHDILSLVALACQMHVLADQPAAADLAHGADLLSLARLLAGSRRYADAVVLSARALRLPLSPATRRAALLSHARYSKAAGDVAAALAAWQSLAGTTSVEGVQACIELAKYHEHCRRDYATAHRYTRQALATAPHCSPRLVPALAHRAARLHTALRRPPASPPTA